VWNREETRVYTVDRQSTSTTVITVVAGCRVV
jgi:hypothetical protein